MSTGSLRRRVTAAVLGLLLIVILAFGTFVTLTYRKSREDDLHHRLAAGGAALRNAWDQAGAKQLVAALHLEGIDVVVRQPGDRGRWRAAGRQARRAVGEAAGRVAAHTARPCERSGQRHADGEQSRRRPGRAAADRGRGARRPSRSCCWESSPCGRSHGPPYARSTMSPWSPRTSRPATSTAG